MTKKQALQEFRSLYSGPKSDKPAKSQAWNDYTDSLCKDGRITSKQYQKWDNPF
jgi:hypothetical protein